MINCPAKRREFGSGNFRAFTMLEVEVSLILSTLAAVTLASLVMQQTHIARRVAGPFALAGELHLVSPADPLLRQLGLPAEIVTQPPTPQPPTTPTIPSGEILILSVDVNASVLIAVVDILPSAPGESP